VIDWSLSGDASEMITLIPIGEVEVTILKGLAPPLTEILGQEAEVAGTPLLLTGGWNQSRHQYLASAILTLVPSPSTGQPGPGYRRRGPLRAGPQLRLRTGAHREDEGGDLTGSPEAGVLRLATRCPPSSETGRQGSHPRTGSHPWARALPRPQVHHVFLQYPARHRCERPGFLRRLRKEGGSRNPRVVWSAMADGRIGEAPRPYT